MPNSPKNTVSGVIPNRSVTGLGACPNAPPELLTSMEADLYPPEDPENAELIDSCLWSLSGRCCGSVLLAITLSGPSSRSYRPTTQPTP